MLAIVDFSIRSPHPLPRHSKMDIDDEDAFLYGDSESIDTKPSTGPGGAVNDVVKTEEAKQNAQCKLRIS
jgi:hypothetical protein